MATRVVGSGLQESIAQIRKAFSGGVNSVQPHELIKSYLKQDGDKLVINKIKYCLQENVYVVGFGKAVIGMIQPIEAALKTSDGVSHLKKGIVSVPFGIQKTLAKSPHLLPTENSSIEILEGAKDNIPDDASFSATKRIVSLIQTLKEQDLLLVLISGGGSALLPFPAPPITLSEKIEIIKSLSCAGATISELNTVRKALSATKGGHLAKLTKVQIVSLILSDIIGSRLDMIASGPTTPNRDPPGAAKNVLEKYNILAPEHVNSVLQRREISSTSLEFSHVTNLVIGNNEKALSGVEASISYQTGGHCLSLVLSSSLIGEASEVGRKLAELVSAATSRIINQDEQLCDSLLTDLCITEEKKKLLIDILEKGSKLRCPICLIFGGETTVAVKGLGRGGRNQEMVLSLSMELEEKMQDSHFAGEVIFLSGGTDGIDGPTDAAGALTYWCSSESGIKSQLQEAQEQGLNPQEFLDSNDSYTYFMQLSSGQYHLKPGHTGTNVMDLQILYITPKCC